MTVCATSRGLEKAKRQLRKCGNKTVLAGLARVSRSTVNNFFRGKNIRNENFQEICRVLELNWEEIADIESPKLTASLQSADQPLINSVPDMVTRPSSLQGIPLLRTLDSCDLAATWLKSNSEGLVTDVCDVILNNDSSPTLIKREDFQDEIIFYIRLVTQSLISLSSTSIYHQSYMRNYFSYPDASYPDISLYIQVFERIKEYACRSASREIPWESVERLKFRFDELINYLKGIRI
jgi:DNA-binding Xre family transcriptional regulator